MAKVRTDSQVLETGNVALEDNTLAHSNAHFKTDAWFYILMFEKLIKPSRGSGLMDEAVPLGSRMRFTT